MTTNQKLIAAKLANRMISRDSLNKQYRASLKSFPALSHGILADLKKEQALIDDLKRRLIDARNENRKGGSVMSGSIEKQDSDKGTLKDTPKGTLKDKFENWLLDSTFGADTLAQLRYSPDSRIARLAHIADFCYQERELRRSMLCFIHLKISEKEEYVEALEESLAEDIERLKSKIRVVEDGISAILRDMEKADESK